MFFIELNQRGFTASFRILNVSHMNANFSSQHNVSNDSKQLQSAGSGKLVFSQVANPGKVETLCYITLYPDHNVKCSS